MTGDDERGAMQTRLHAYLYFNDTARDAMESTRASSPGSSQ
jgi:hypothetical protein